jgi:hypothetical protein
MQGESATIEGVVSRRMSSRRTDLNVILGTNRMTPAGMCSPASLHVLTPSLPCHETIDPLPVVTRAIERVMGASHGVTVAALNGST